MNQSSPDLVSVIVPAYNAAATLAETLASVQAQTYPHLEIIVVDDGSTDGTGEIARAFAMRDLRIRILRQDNSGSSIARNHGITVAHGRFVALLDADDLWHPRKIERQIEAFSAGGDQIGLVYTWFAAIDERSRITSLGHRPSEEGDVRRAMCRSNFVGNGSSPLILREAILAVGGYDPAYPHFCEDLKLYFLIAERYRFAVVREHLTGYRQSPRSMSNKVLQMLHAYDLVMDEFRPRYAEFADEFREGRKQMVAWLFGKAVKAGQWREARVLFAILLKADARLAAELVARERAVKAPFKARAASRTLSSMSRGLTRLKAAKVPKISRPFLYSVFYSLTALAVNWTSASSL